MKIDETGLSHKTLELNSKEIRNVLDRIFKLSLPAGKFNIKADTITSLDGISLGRLDLPDDRSIRNRMTIYGTGKVSQSPGARRGIATAAEAGLEIGARAVGIGSVLPLKVMGEKILRQAGLIKHNGIAQYKARLRVRTPEGVQDIGHAVYTVRKFESLDDIPQVLKHLVPADHEHKVLGKPALISEAHVNLNVPNAIELAMGESLELDKLNESHLRKVLVTAYYNIQVDAAEGAVRRIHDSNHLPLELEPYEWKIVSTVRK
jgi:hypothetical protein